MRVWKNLGCKDEALGSRECNGTYCDALWMEEIGKSVILNSTRKLVFKVNGNTLKRR